MQHIMLDLETLGTAVDSVILSIGAVKFDPETESPLGEKFCLTLSIQSNLDAGRTVSGDTIKWWMGQDAEARAVFSAPCVSLNEALTSFVQFFDHDNYQVWGNGASFDNAIMAHALDSMGWKTPWKFYNDRCYRTLKAMPGVPKMSAFVGKHNALTDACAQALHMQTFYNSLKAGV